MSTPVNSNTFYRNIYDKLEHSDSVPSENTPYEVLNPLKADITQRSDENVSSMRNLLFEFDELSLDEQEELIENNKNHINRVVFSGNKSYHVRITLLEEPESKEEYKFIWKKINDELFSGNADPQCKNPSRLTRCPGAFREGTDRLQSLYYYSEFQFFDADRYHTEFNELKEQNKFIYPPVQLCNNNNKIPYESLNSVEAKYILDNFFPQHQRVAILKKGIPSLIYAGYSISEIREHILTISESDRRYDSLRFLQWFNLRISSTEIPA